MRKQLTTAKLKLRKLTTLCWSHRAMYLGLAACYGAVCLGWLDKGTANEVTFACYLAIWAQKH